MKLTGTKKKLFSVQLLDYHLCSGRRIEKHSQRTDITKLSVGLLITEVVCHKYAFHYVL